MFEETIPWVVIYWVFKYTGRIIASCESAAAVDQVEMPHVPVQSPQSFPLCAADGVWLCLHGCPRGQPLPPLPVWLVWDMVSVSDLVLACAPCVWLCIGGEWDLERQGTLWNLQKMSRGIRSFQCLIFQVVRRACALVLSNKKTSLNNFKRI